MINPVDIEIATFEAKCGECSHLFDHPSFGDQSYGEFIFCSENGRIYSYLIGFSAIDKLFEVLLPQNCGNEMFQSALAEFADPIFGQKLKTRIRCPKCTSTKLEYWGGKKTGSMWVKPTSYTNLLSLKRNDLINKFSDYAKNFHV